MFNALFKHDVDLERMTIDRAEKLLKEGVTVVEGNKPLKEVYKDTDILIEVLNRFDIGTRQDQMIRLTDPTDKNVVNKVRADLKKHAKANPDLKILFFMAFCGHGVQVDGEQVLLINCLNKRTKFFEWWAAEADIRLIAKKFPNTFSVGIFACCRELFSPKRHCGYFKGTKKEA